MLFPGNRNQQHAAACIFFELKWGDSIVPNLGYLESKYEISRRVLQRARAKLSRVGLIEHVSYLNSRYGGRHGWKLSSRFETSLRQLAGRCSMLRDKTTSSIEKDKMMLELADANRSRHQGSSYRPQDEPRWKVGTNLAHVRFECDFEGKLPDGNS